MDQTGMNGDRVDDDSVYERAVTPPSTKSTQWKASQLSDKTPRAITQKMKLAPVGKAVSIARKVPWRGTR